MKSNDHSRITRYSVDWKEVMAMQMKTGQAYQKTYQLIAGLASQYGLSGRESAIGESAAELLRRYVPDASYLDGSVIAHIKSGDNKPVLLICAHLDQVGFLVTDITDDGFLRIGAVGGIDRRLLLGQPVMVVGTADGETVLSGVISILPPHLLKGEQAVPEESQLCVDLGFESAERIQAVVRPGDAVYYASACKRLGGDCMTGPALDDRCGVAALILAAESLSAEKDLPCSVTFVLSGQEERGGRGAKLAAYNEPADYAIAVDVTFGISHDDTAGCYAVGSGPAIGISAVLSPDLTDIMKKAAVSAGISFQIEVMSSSTGTDADHLALAPGGCAAGTLSIPLRYMHTPVEVVSLKDVEQTAELLTSIAKECVRV